MHDVSHWDLVISPLSGRYPKLELHYAGQHYILKFASYRQNGLEVPYHVSEYISSKLIKSMGYSVHDVALAEYLGRPGCLVMKFNETLVPVGGLGTSTLSGEHLPYDLDIMHELFNEGKYAFDFSSYLWDTFCIDAFIANLDRHPNNWGFFKRGDVYYNAPLYDNASSLYSVNAFDLDKMSNLEEYIHKFSKSMVSYHGERRSFESILLSEKSNVFKERLILFKDRLSSLDLSSLDDVALAWPSYRLYINFVKAFLDRQVNWFETKI